MAENINEILGLNTTSSEQSPISQSIASNGKSYLLVDNYASTQLANINTILMIIAIISLFAGIICFLVGLSSYENHFLTTIGIGTFIGSINIFIGRVFVNALIQITKSAEYYNTKIKTKYEIKEE